MDRVQRETDDILGRHLGHLQISPFLLLLILLRLRDTRQRKNNTTEPPPHIVPLLGCSIFHGILGNTSMGHQFHPAAASLWLQPAGDYATASLHWEPLPA